MTHRVTGTIIDCEACTAIVEVEAAEACARCARGEGCGAGIWSNRQDAMRLRARLPSGACPLPGSRVDVELCDGGIAHAALLGYGLPLAGLVIGAALGAVTGGDTFTAIGGLLGLLSGILLARRLPAGQPPEIRL